MILEKAILAGGLLIILTSLEIGLNNFISSIIYTLCALEHSHNLLLNRF